VTPQRQGREHAMDWRTTVGAIWVVAVLAALLRALVEAI
jgi:hypothetical protein